MSELNKPNENNENNENENFEESTIFSDYKPNLKPKPKKNPYFKMISILLSITILCTATALGIYFLAPDLDNKNPVTPNVEAFSLTQAKNVALNKMKNPDKNAITNILSVSVTNKKGSFLLKPEKNNNAEIEGEFNYLIQNQEDLPINQTFVNTIANSVFSFTALKEIDSKYSKLDVGLEKPVVIVNVKMADKSDFSIFIGNIVPDGSGNYYGSTSLNDKIYIVEQNNYEVFSQGLEDVVDTTLISQIAQTSDNDPYFNEGVLNRYDEINLTGSAFEQPIKLSYQDSKKEVWTYLVTDPVRTYADSNSIETLMLPFNDGLFASGVYKLRPNQADLKKYGLDKPYYEATYKIKGETYNIKLSKPSAVEDGYYACVVEGIPVVYKLLEDTAEFSTIRLKNLRNALIFVRDIGSVKSVVAEFDGKKYKFEIFYEEVVSKNEGKEEDEQKSYEFSIRLNGKPVKAENFQRIYQEVTLLKAVSFLQIGEKQPTNSPVLKLTYNYNDGSNSEVLEFKKYDERYYHLSINKIGDQLIRYDTVDSIISNYKKLINNQDVESPV